MRCKGEYPCVANSNYFTLNMVFTLPNPRPLEIAIAKKIDKNFARNTEWRQLSNGEWVLRIPQTPKKTLVLGRTEAPGDNLLQTLTLIDTLHRNGAKDITLVLPYFGYSRHDRVIRKGDHLPADLFTNLFKHSGATRIVTIDLHNSLTAKNSPVPLTNIGLTKEFVARFKKIVWKNAQLTIVSPDEGSKKRAEKFRTILGPALPVSWLEKHRDPKTGTVRSGKLIGPRQGTTALIIDDICDTGSTIKECVRELKKNGFKTFYLCVTHSVFSGTAIQTLRLLKFKKIFVSNTIPLSEKAKSSLPITVVDATSSITEILLDPPMDIGG